MDGADDASNEEKLAGIAEQADHDHGTGQSAAKTEYLQDRVEEADVEPE